MIPYGRQSVSQADIDAVVEVLRSDYLTQGPAVERFETALATYCDAQHAVAVSNGTAALHLAMLALGVGEGSLVWTSPNSFAASANCARYCGADVDFVDIDPGTFNMGVDALASKLELAAASGRLPDVVIPVHHSGLPCDMEAIAALAERYGFTVMEDACHALGGSYGAERIGSCTHSAMTVFSFHPVKTLTTGEGGAVLTNSDELAGRIALLRSHGITRDPALMVGPRPGAEDASTQPETPAPWHYEMVELGFNYRITDIQCALGTSQLTRLDEWVARRGQLAARYDRLLADLPVHGQAEGADRVSARHLYVVRMAADRRDEVGRAMREAGVLVNLHYAPIHLQPYYRHLGFSPGDFPQAELYGREALTLPLFPSMSDGDVDTVVGLLASLV